jgi:hypothetical protein
MSKMRTSIADYLSNLSSDTFCEQQNIWYDKLTSKIESGIELYNNADTEIKELYQSIFQYQVRTEELKAWYGSPSEGSLFQGTSVTSLTIPAVVNKPILLEDISQLEEAIADEYIVNHDKYRKQVTDAIVEDVSHWIEEGLYYGVVIGSKMITQAFGLTVPNDDICFEVDGHLVDPHEITSYPAEVRKKYFDICREKIECFNGLDMTVTEFETSLVLADISKPNIESYKNKIMLAPIRCNELCTLISMNVTKLIREKSNGRIKPRTLCVTIYDTDTPYTYHKVEGFYGKELSPVLPGLTIMGSSGTIDSFKWLYTYRTSLITQKMMKSSLYSEVSGEYIPFVFMGVLVPRDAEILLDLDNLDKLRYRGNISPYMEFCYLLNSIKSGLEACGSYEQVENFKNRIR